MQQGRPSPGILDLDRVPPTVLVALGAALGTAVRWLAEEAVATPALALDSLAVGLVIAGLNVAGSALVGWLAGRGHRGSSLWRLGAIGFGGGLTTFSSYVVDVARRLDQGDFTGAAGLSAANIVLTIAAAAVAYSLAHPSNAASTS